MSTSSKTVNILIFVSIYPVFTRLSFRVLSAVYIMWQVNDICTKAVVAFSRTFFIMVTAFLSQMLFAISRALHRFSTVAVSQCTLS